MKKNECAQEILLNGLDGSNPLGFLATIGATVVLGNVFSEIHLGWKITGGGWRPLIRGGGINKEEFSKNLFIALKNAPMTVFDIDNKLPFDAGKFSRALKEEQHHMSMENRRNADFLCAFGTELYSDKEGQFQVSSFRMVRTGDSAGQGLPFYIKAIRDKINLDHVQRAVFHTWDYQDEGYSLRWDPIEDQRYALRWENPSGSTDGPKSMLAANCLAGEALQLFPSLLVGNKIQTTGFQQLDKNIFFIWPIWTRMVGIETVRSLLSLSNLAEEPSLLARRGIEAVYKSQRIHPSKYYSNFSPAEPL